MERLQKILAQAGLASRRECERIIAEGRVTVNGEAVSQMGLQVDPEKDDIRCDGARVRLRYKVYFLLNKPRGYLCTQKDEYGRKRAADLLVGVKERVFPVGRLDKESQGLLLFTNDGELSNRLTHPRYGIPKTYLAVVKGELKPQDLEKLSQGLRLSEGRVQAERAAVRFSSHGETAVEIVLREGRNREVRRMLAQLGYEVKRLKRTRIGDLTDRGLEVGHFRPLSPDEVASLKGEGPPTARARGKRKSGKQGKKKA